MAYHSGKSGKVMIAGAELGVKEWSAEHSVDGNDNTTTTAGGRRTMQAGLEQLTFKLSAFFDATKNPTALAGIKPGATGAVELFAKNDDAEPTYDITASLILKANIKSAVDGIVEYDIEGHANDWE